MEREEILKQMEEQSREDEFRVPPVILYPILRLNGQTNKFYLIEFDKEGNKSVAEVQRPLKGVILTSRRKLFSFTREELLFSNEYLGTKEEITLFRQNRKTKKVQRIDKGLEDPIREKYPNLKVQFVLYVLFRNKLVKLPVKGASLSHLFDFYREFSSGEHVFEYNTIFDSQEEESELGKYFALTFTKGEKLQLEDLKIAAEELNKLYQDEMLRQKYFKSLETVQETEEEVSETPTETPKEEDLEKIPIVEENE